MGNQWVLVLFVFLGMENSRLCLRVCSQAVKLHAFDESLVCSVGSWNLPERILPFDLVLKNMQMVRCDQSDTVIDTLETNYDPLMTLGHSHTSFNPIPSGLHASNWACSGSWPWKNYIMDHTLLCYWQFALALLPYVHLAEVLRCWSWAVATICCHQIMSNSSNKKCIYIYMYVYIPHSPENHNQSLKQRVMVLEFLLYVHSWLWEKKLVCPCYR